MDQLKVILQHVKKHHFWLLCGDVCDRRPGGLDDGCRQTLERF